MSIARDNTSDHQVHAFVETEVEWRVRVTLREAQRVLDSWLRGNYCIVDTYRVRRHAGFVRRVGSRTHHQNYNFSTVGDYLREHGLRLASDRPTVQSPQQVDLFSEIKTTNCAHQIFKSEQATSHVICDGRATGLLEQLTAADRRSGTTATERGQLERDVRWAQLFLLKRSLELHDCSLDAQSLAQVDCLENDRSDNNLGLSVVRKVYRFLEMYREDDPAARTFEYRVALYSFLDEYQQIRYELAVEHEFDGTDGRQTRDFVSPYDHAVSRRLCDTAVGAHRPDYALVRRVHASAVRRAVDGLAFLSRLLVRTCLEFNLATMPQLHIDWSNEDPGLSNGSNPLGGGLGGCSTAAGVALSTERAERTGDLLAESDDLDEVSSTTNTSSLGAVAPVAGSAFGDDEPDDEFPDDDAATLATAEPCSRVASRSTGDAARNEAPRGDGTGNSLTTAAVATASTTPPLSLNTVNFDNGRLLSYALQSTENGCLELFDRFVRRSVLSHVLAGNLRLRRKVDGTRIFATFSGRDRFCLDNGSALFVSPQDARAFSTDFIYQFERLDPVDGSDSPPRYVLTEVVAVRNNYAHEPNALLHTFASSVNRYPLTPEQQWPYGLEGTGLSPSETQRLLAFWAYSGCGAALAVKQCAKIVARLRDDSDLSPTHSADAHTPPVDSSCSVCATCSTHLANTSGVYGGTGRVCAFRNFIALTSLESLCLLERIDRVTSAAFVVNRDLCVRTADDLSSEITRFYRYSVLRLADVLYANLLFRRGLELLQLHFEHTEARYYHDTYVASVGENGSLVLPVPRLAVGFRDDIPIDGYLLCPSTLSERRTFTVATPRIVAGCPRPQPCTPRSRSTCVYNGDIYPDDHRRRVGQHRRVAPFRASAACDTSYKLKPFQTIELLCILRPSLSASDLRHVHFCVRATILEQQQDLEAHTYLVANNVSVVETDLGQKLILRSARWTNLLGTDVQVYIDPLVSLADQQIYEFVVYNETTFFLVQQRDDKIVADCEKKVNSIVYHRKLLSDQLSSLSTADLDHHS